METYYTVGTFAEMLNTHIKYLIKTALEITEIILAKVFRKNKKKQMLWQKSKNTAEQSKTFPRKIF